MTSRQAVEREVLARLLSVRDVGVLHRRLLGLRLLGVGNKQFSGDNASAFRAIVALASVGERVDVEAVAHQAGGDADYLTWITTAYRSATPLATLAAALLDVERRARVDSIGRTLINAVGDPAGDVDRAVAAAVGALRRLARRAA